MRYRALAALLLTGLPWLGAAQTQYHPLEVGKKPDTPKTKSVKLSVWSASPVMSAKLAPEKPLFGWSIRPPQGFVSTQKSEGTNQIFVFQGDPRPDSTSPVLWVLLGDVRQTGSKQPKDEVVMDQYMIELHKNRDEWKASPTQFGMIQGRKFLRRRWSAAESINGVMHRLHGTIYITLIGAKFASVIVQDADPGAASTIGLMEASALTFRKR